MVKKCGFPNDLKALWFYLKIVQICQLRSRVTKTQPCSEHNGGLQGTGSCVTSDFPYQITETKLSPEEYPNLSGIYLKEGSKILKDLCGKLKESYKNLTYRLHLKEVLAAIKWMFN